MNPANNKRLETFIYAGLWTMAIILFLLDIMRSRSYTDLPVLDLGAVGRLLRTMLPMMVLFAVNNYLLIPRLLKRGLYVRYIIMVLCSIVAVWLWQQYDFFSIQGFEDRPPRQRPHHPGPHPLLPLPIFLDLIYDCFIIGVNLAISLIFQQFADRLKHESLMKEHAEHQLAYLKAQINPHFYMNMLNNIHGMIEIDSEKAQEMVISLSSLMRYMLYDSSRAETDFSSEIKFIKDYLALMRVRYAEDAVSITAAFPDPKSIAGIKTPPLLFLAFLENAFKHGISYSSDSFVSVSISVGNGTICFRCMNSIHDNSGRDGGHKGIGLGNVKRRLDIIYGKDYNLEIEQTDSIYTVTLSLPTYEAKDTDN